MTTLEQQLGVRQRAQDRERKRMTVPDGPNDRQVRPSNVDGDIAVRKCMKCMNCGEDFVSDGIGNRLCPKHAKGTGLAGVW